MPSQAIAAVSTELVRQALASGAAVEARVDSGSMLPLIGIGDIVRIVSVRPEALAKGDIVVYNAGNSLAVHRVVGRTRLPDGREVLVTKGDANGTADEPVAAEAVAGRIVQVVSQSGSRIDLTGLAARTISRLIAVMSFWSGVIWDYRSRPSRGVTDRAGKVLVKPVGAVTRRVCVILTKALAGLCRQGNR